MKSGRLLIAWSFLAFSVLDAGTPSDAPWSFAPLRRPPVPQPQAADWAHSDLDRFILARLEAEGLAPNPDADRRTLIRRAFLDLTGLPPEPGAIDAFLRDPSPDDRAFARVVDACLESERFGERWARHWLDVARYADSVGRTWNSPFVYAWRYRDWTIDAFNADKPYNRFIAEQLAGDLLPAQSVEQRREQIVATGFLALGALAINMGTNEQFILDQVDDQIDVATRGFLGLSVACARCHDHKYDPVSQRDYYALAGIFYSSWTYPGQAHVSDQAGHGYVDPEMLVRLPTDLDSGLDRVRDVPAGIHSMSDLRQFGGKAPPPYEVMPHGAMGMREGKPADCALREGGVFSERGETPPRGEILIPGLPEFPDVPADQSGRLQLAQWIASPAHPLTSRVMVNRVWQHLFGRGLVETVDNFGASGREPSHPELLDHLALRFVEGGWSVKGLIRGIMLSRTYQLSSDTQSAAHAVDPDNTLYWRFTPHRLELEALRDSMLFVSGKLQEDRPEPGHLAGSSGRGRGRTRGDIGFDSPYRTIYLPVLRDLLPDDYGVFDFPDPSAVNGLRHVTTSAPQALFFMNSRFVEDTARDTVDRLFDSAKSDEDRMDLAYELIFSRRPSGEDIEGAFEMMRGLDTAGLADPERHRWAVFVQALFAHAEFRYVL